MFLSYVKPILLIVLMPLLLVINFSVLILLFPILACFSMVEGLDFNVLNASSINRHDCITFTVNTERHNIQISALYVSPSTKACFSLFPEVVDSQVLVGDFNAKHKTFGCINSNISGRALKKFTQEYSFLILNSKSPTFYHRSHPYSEILDLVFASKSILDAVLSCEVGPDVNSDHLPVTLKLDLRQKDKL